MKNINNCLKVFSILMLFTLLFSVAAFAEPDNGQNETPEPGISEVDTLVVTEPETVPSENTEAHSELSTDITEKQTETTKASTTTAVKTTTHITSAVKSSNANLASLSLKGFTADNVSTDLILSPEFNADTKVYSVEVPTEIVSLEISAKAENRKADPEFPQKYVLEQNNNIVKIVVTAEDGTKKTYEIIVKYKEAETTESVSTTVSSTEPSTLITASPNYSKTSMNTYTKLGIVFAVGGAALLGISIYLFFKKKS